MFARTYACFLFRFPQHVNHTLASLSDGAKNPFRKGHTEVPTNFVEPPPGIDMRTGAPSS
jgi:hypothetical protein